TKEQLDETVIENVEKARESVVVGEDVMIGFLRRRKRQCALRSEQPHIFDKDLEGLVFAVLDAGKVGSRKLHERILSKKDEFLAQRRAFADARLAFMKAFEMPQHGEIVEAPRLRFQIAQQARRYLARLAHNGLRIPIRGGHRMTSPRSTERI